MLEMRKMTHKYMRKCMRPYVGKAYIECPVCAEKKLNDMQDALRGRTYMLCPQCRNYADAKQVTHVLPATRGRHGRIRVTPYTYAVPRVYLPLLLRDQRVINQPAVYLPKKVAELLAQNYNDLMFQILREQQENAADAENNPDTE